MSYYKAEEVLPEHIIKEIQKYVDGHSIYVPKKPDNRKNWGESTETLSFLEKRNEQIILNIWMAALLPNFQQNIIW